MGELRQRRTSPSEQAHHKEEETTTSTRKQKQVGQDHDHNQVASNTSTNKKITYTVAQWMILRLVGFVYFIAFLGAYHQNGGLFGSYGLQPISNTWNSKSFQNQYASAWEGFFHHPTLFWWMTVSDRNVNIVTILGIVVSALVTFCNVDSMILLFLLWILDFSIVTLGSIGTNFYSYGWESQLLETGFLAIFLCQTMFLPSNPRNNWFLKNWFLGRRQQRQEQQQRQKQQPNSLSMKTTTVHSSSNNISSTCDSSHIIILWLFRWLCFRISLGAGLIKIRGDSCWTEKTCLYYHFETQPIPSPMSFIFHFLPKWMLHHAVDLDLLVQVYTSWMVLLVYRNPNPRTSYKPSIVLRWMQRVNLISLQLLRMGGFIQVGFMINIILSGNFAFLNHLTIIPALACLDDGCWPQALVNWISPDKTIAQDSANAKDIASNTMMTGTDTPSLSSSATKQRSKRVLVANLRLLLEVSLFFWIGVLSMPVIENLFQFNGTRQQMNASFDRFRLVNTYGAFGSVGQARYEPIISISYNGRKWIELEFPCKPGSTTRRPCFCAPYHYRLDWNIWFIGFKPHLSMARRRESWIFSLLASLMNKNLNESQRPWLDLFDQTSAKMLRDNYNKYKVPRYAKVDMYHYEMAAPLWDIVLRYVQQEGSSFFYFWPFPKTMARSDISNVTWWNRTFEEILIPPVTVDMESKELVVVNL